MNAPLQIRRILAVTDTREWEEGPDDKFHPVPGSGVESECARCGRLHEIHARVELADGREAIVGTGCMAKDSLVPDDAKRVRSADRLAKRLRQLDAEIAAVDRRLARWEADHAAVAALAAPPVERCTVALSVGRHAGEEHPAVRCGDGARMWCNLVRNAADMAERERVAVWDWRSKRMAERGWESSDHGSTMRALSTRLRAQRDKATARLDELLRKDPSA